MRSPPSFAQLLLVWGSLLVLPRACETAEPASVQTECASDDDCVLMPPGINCCGECPPAPPFEAVPSTQLASLLIQLETDCAESTRLCEPPTCDIVPESCDARAICVDGRCRVSERGCAP